MMVVALLRQSDLILEPEDLRAVFAHRAVHVVAAFQNLANAVGKCRDDLGMVVQIAGLHELGIGIGRRNLVGEAVDPVDQDATEQEIGKDNDPLESKPHDMLKTGLNQRECHAGIANLCPAEAHPLPQHPGNLRDVGIGVRIRRAAPDDNKAGICPVNLAMFGVSSLDGSGDPVTGGLQHLQIDSQFAPILDRDAMLGGIGVEHRRNVILRMSGGKQHAGHRQDMRHTLFAKLVETGLDHRCGKFEIAIFHRPVGEQGSQLFSQHGKFGNRRFRARTMSADHHTIFGSSSVMHGSCHPLRQKRPNHPPRRRHPARFHCQERQARPRR